MQTINNHLVNREASVEHYQLATMVDVVFGVMIGIPILDVPEKLINLINNFNLASATPVLLLCSAIIFCILYWFGEHEFMAEQKKFDRKLAELTKEPNAIPAMSPQYLAGIFVVILIFASILIFAKENAFRLFLIANISYWICDFIGNVSIKRIYRGSYNAIIKLIDKDSEQKEHWWFSGHVNTNYFYFYSLGNILIFVGFLSIDIFFIDSIQFRFFITCAILIITILRYIFWLIIIYESYIKHKHKVT